MRILQFVLTVCFLGISLSQNLHAAEQYTYLKGWCAQQNYNWPVCKFLKNGDPAPSEKDLEEWCETQNNQWPECKKFKDAASKPGKKRDYTCLKQWCGMQNNNGPVCQFIKKGEPAPSENDFKSWCQTQGKTCSECKEFQTGGSPSGSQMDLETWCERQNNNGPECEQFKKSQSPKSQNPLGQILGPVVGGTQLPSNSAPPSLAVASPTEGATLNPKQAKLQLTSKQPVEDSAQVVIEWQRQENGSWGKAAQQTIKWKKLPHPLDGKVDGLKLSEPGKYRVRVRLSASSNFSPWRNYTAK